MPTSPGGAVLSPGSTDLSRLFAAFCVFDFAKLDETCQEEPLLGNVACPYWTTNLFASMSCKDALACLAVLVTNTALKYKARLCRPCELSAEAAHTVLKVVASLWSTSLSPF